MNTTNSDNNNGNLDSILNIRAVSGGERGNKEAGKKYDYLIPKVLFLELIGEVFDKEVERSNKENAKSGGAVSQFLHSYGATADKMEKAGIDPFPAIRYDLRNAATREVVAANVTEAEGNKWLADYGGDVKPVWEQLPGGTFDGDCVEKWLELMEFKAPRNGGNRKSAKEVKMETILTTLSIPGISWSMLSSAYPDITEADLEAYKAKLAAKAGE
jgi:hypothetical protein